MIRALIELLTAAVNKEVVVASVVIMIIKNASAPIILAVSNMSNIIAMVVIHLFGEIYQLR